MTDRIENETEDPNFLKEDPVKAKRIEEETIQLLNNVLSGNIETLKEKVGYILKSVHSPPQELFQYLLVSFSYAEFKLKQIYFIPKIES